MNQSLEDLQAWFQTVMTHPVGVRAGIASAEATRLIDVSPDNLNRVILPSTKLNSLDRLQIYGSAYFGRLIECLQAQFPAVRHAVGEESFNAFAYGYLIQNPSMSYTLASLGYGFDEFLAATRPSADDSTAGEPDFADFVVDLARLEKTYNQVFDGPGPEAARLMQPDDFAGLTAAGFANCRLVLFGCVRLATFRFPVHEYASELRRGLDPVIPSARETKLVITRRDYIVRRFEINELQYRLLSSLQLNATVGEALVSLFDDPAVDLTAVQAELQPWFYEWAAAPLFASLDANPLDDGN